MPSTYEQHQSQYKILTQANRFKVNKVNTAWSILVPDDVYDL